MATKKSRTNPALTEEQEQQREANNANIARHAEGEPPKVGAEGGVIQEGTGDFAPGTTDTGGYAGETVKAQTRDGRVVEVEVGIDGKNPVSVNNPPRKAALGGIATDARVVGGEDNPTEVLAVNDGIEGDRVDEDMAKAAEARS